MDVRASGATVNIQSTDANRASLYLYTQGDDACDLYFGTNTVSNRYSFSTRGSFGDYDLILYRNNGSWIRMTTWDWTNGFVGIGVSTPVYQLDVSGTGRFDGDVILSGASRNIDFESGAGNVTSPTGLDVVIDDDATSTSSLFRVQHDAGSDLFSVSEAQYVQIHSRTTEPSGSPDGGLYVNGNATGTDTIYFYDGTDWEPILTEAMATGDFIQNQYSSEQTADWLISGKGKAHNTAANDTALIARATGSNATGMVGTGTYRGVVGVLPSDSNLGILGTGDYGVYGEVNASGETGVYGTNTSTSASGTQFGVRGSVTGAGGGTSIHYGVYGTASGGGTNWAGYFVGNVNASQALFIGNVPDDAVADSILTIDGGQVKKIAAGSIGGGDSLWNDEPSLGRIYNASSATAAERVYIYDDGDVTISDGDLVLTGGTTRDIWGAAGDASYDHYLDNGYIGFKFTPDEDMTVTQARALWAADWYLMDASFSVLAGPITFGIDGVWQTQTLGSPVALTAGNDYWLRMCWDVLYNYPYSATPPDWEDGTIVDAITSVIQGGGAASCGTSIALVMYRFPAIDMIYEIDAGGTDGHIAAASAIRTGSTVVTDFSHFGSGGSVGFADDASDVYIQDELEVDGNFYLENVPDDAVHDSVLTIDGGQVRKVAASSFVDADWTEQTSPADYIEAKAGGITSNGATLYGVNANTHINLGFGTSVTGLITQNYGYATIGGGNNNTSSESYTTVAGGTSNTASGNCAVVGGGQTNTASGNSSAITGGANNTAGFTAAVGGGYLNTASGSYSAIPGGHSNYVLGQYSAIPGGYADTVSGQYSLAFGNDVNVSTDYTSQFYSSSNKGILRAYGDLEFSDMLLGGIGYADSFWIYDDGDTTRFDADNPIKIGDASLIVETDGDVRATQRLYVGNVPDDAVADSVLTIDGGQVKKIATSSLSDADWTINGVDQYSAVSGNVGIGTTTPADKLEVDGNIRLTDNTSAYRIGADDVLRIQDTGCLFTGVEAGPVSTGNYNTYVGWRAGRVNTSGQSNTFVGANAGLSNIDGAFNTFIGQGVGQANSNGWSNTFIGYLSGAANISGMCNVFTGQASGNANTIGVRNTFTGYMAGRVNISGDNNTFTGFYAGFNNNSGSRNTATGNYAGYTNSTGNNNVFIGGDAGYLNTGSNGVFIGYQSGYNEVNSNRLYIDNSNTATPLIYGEFDSDLLRVNGDLYAAQELHIGNVPDDAVADSVLTIDGGQVKKIAVSSLADADWTIGSGVIYNTTDNVGIGTTTPGAALEIYKDTAPILLLSRPAAIQQAHIKFNTSAGNDWQIGKQTSDDFIVMEGASARMYFEGGGNIGIGTTSPGALLHVSGRTANIGQSNTVTFPSGSWGANIAIGATNTITGGRGTTLLGYENTAADDFCSVIGVRNTIDAGISGGHILGLDNTVFATDAFSIGRHIVNNVAYSVQIGSRDTDGDGAITILNGGNVGIATISPASDLDVNGTIRADHYRDNAGGNLLNNGTGISVAEQADGSWTITNTASGITGSGTDNYLARWNGTSALQSSAVYVTDGGNVGIGTATPSYPLHVIGSEISLAGSNTIAASTGGSYVAIGGGINISGGGTSAWHTKIGIGYNADVTTSAFGMALGYTVSTSQSYSNVLGINSSITGSGSGSHVIGNASTCSASNGYSFGSDNVVTASGAMAIGRQVTNDVSNSVEIGASSTGTGIVVNSSNNVGIGTTSPTYKLHVVGRFKSDGITETSDARFKNNIQPIDDALNKVLAMRGVTYEWNKEGMESGTQIGLIAQEVEKVLPEVVDTDQEGYKSLQYSVMVALLIEAMKDQQQTIEDLQSEQQNIIERIESLEKSLSRTR